MNAVIHNAGSGPLAEQVYPTVDAALNDPPADHLHPHDP